MRYYPVFLDIQNRNCLVVGGGDVGRRKVLMLLNCGAVVTVVSPTADEKLLELAANNLIELINRPYQASDLDGMFLVIGATNNDKLNLQIKRDTEHLNILCNIADRPEACNFILPSVVNKGDLVIAISTSGKSPAFAKKLRKDLDKKFGQEYAEFLKLMGAIRDNHLSQHHEPEDHKQLFEQLIDRGLIDMIRDQKKEAINALLSEILGKGYEFEALMNL
jgi:precorrin-2 dehydrogenase/sirohydrochlorin ferrochelatase